MKNHLTGLWNNTQKRLTSTLEKLTDEHLRFKLNDTTASLGFLMLHIGESQMSLANIFYGAVPDFKATYSYAATDDGKEIPLALIRKTLTESGEVVLEAIEKFSDAQWAETVDTRFGALSRFDALAFIINHSAYHHGQAVLTLKRGQ